MQSSQLPHLALLLSASHATAVLSCALLRSSSPVALADQLCWLSCVAGLQLTSAHHDGADAQLLEGQGALEGLTLHVSMNAQKTAEDKSIQHSIH
jgi:hypothetical protein